VRSGNEGRESIALEKNEVKNEKPMLLMPGGKDIWEFLAGIYIFQALVGENPRVCCLH
jgi:hypothetical protein